MSSSDISSVTDQLAKTKVDEQNELSFKGKGLKLNNADDAKDLVTEIENCQVMTALRMEGNTLGVDAAEVIAKALEKHPEFQRAHWSDMFTGRLKTEIPQALEFLGAAIMKAGAGLVTLDLSDNAFGPNGVVGLVNLLKSSSCYTLQELRLNNNGLGITGGKMLTDCLTECHQNSVKAGKPLKLKVFVSGRNRLENPGATALAAVFKALGSLEEVAMPQNGINAEGVTALAEAFAENKNLRVMNLSDNTFTHAGAKNMAKVLPKLQNLEVINFGDCLVRTDGAIALSHALKDGHQKLKELNLSGNEINKQGASAVAENMENKLNLTRLDLNCNMLGEEGIEEVRGTMEAIGKLDILASLSDDEGSDDGEGENQYVEEDVAQDIVEGEEMNDPALQVKGKAITPNKQTTAKDFLAFPSPNKLLQLGSGRAQALREELGADVNDIEKAVHTFMKISSVVTMEDTKIKEAACDCADQIIEEAVKCNRENDAVLLSNTILVYMGVLKGEDKSYKPPSNITGPLLVLEHIVRQPYFPKFSREMLQAFCSKPHPLLDSASQARHKLLQTLYAF
ncbi:ran GTPase-activating protein 1-like [Ostrea edulis]|uniref:ran GTPase-activating protein 1-like n=1 Tax=Ostrea edulis TaxID=37623 RepID=UPI0024AF8E01|nr:ran GTPase-activating protein 1-like [Ostrea edulis]